ncbi:MAG: hypothetical protein K6T26_03335 [Alicyclobacillus sp.]|nr:hypothetical protein [Alicyclobacillus sp.]
MGRLRITWVAAACGAAMAALAVGCGGGSPEHTASDNRAVANAAGLTGGPQQGGSMVIGQATQFDTTFIPQLPSELYTNNIVSFTFDSLMWFDKNLNFHPDLAQSWSWSADKRTVTIHLDPAANWSDGQPVTSDDVLFTMDFLASKTYRTTLQGQYSYLVSEVVGADDIYSGKAKSFADTGGFKKIDEKTFAVTFKQVDAAVLWSDLAPLTPIPKHVLQNIPYQDFITCDFDKKPTVVDGPYQFVRVDGTNAVELTANPHYFRGVPHIQNITFKTVSADVAPALLKDGSLTLQLDGLRPVDVDKLRQLPGVQVQVEPSMSYQYLGLKLNHPEFNLKFRQALMYGINRQGLVDGLLKGLGKVLNVPLPDASWAAAGPSDGINPYPYNPEKANQLLDEAGWKIGPNGWRIDPVTGKDTIPLDYPIGNAVRVSSATAIQQDLANLHLKVDLHTPQDIQALVRKIRTNDPSIYMWLLGWTLTVDPDPRGMYRSDDSYNWPDFKDAKNDQLIAATAGAAAFDPRVRRQAFIAWEKYYNEQVPYVFLYQPDNLYAYSTRLQIPADDWTVLGPINPQDWWLKP